MANEAVEILIDADDQASKKLEKVGQSAEKMVKEFKETGAKAKASTELVGTFATTLGATPFGAYAGSLAMMTERISAFSEVAEQGGIGATAFKAGLAGVAGVLAFQVGKAFGDVIFQTQRFTQALEDAKLKSQELETALLNVSGKRLEENLTTLKEMGDLDARRIEAAKLEADIAGQIASKQEKIKGFAAEIATTYAPNRLQFAKNLVGWDTKRVERLREQIKLEEASIDTLNERALTLRDIIAGVNDAAEVEKESIQKSKDFIQGLRAELELLKATKEETFAIEAERGTGGRDAKIAEQLLREKDAILAAKEAEKERAAEAKRAEAERLRDLERQKKERESMAKAAKAEIDNSLKSRMSVLQQLKKEAIQLKDGEKAAEAYALQLQGFDKATAAGLADLKDRLKAKVELSVPEPVQATQGRLLTRGPRDTHQEKIEKNTADQAKAAREMIKELHGIAAQLKAEADRKKNTIDVTLLKNA